jgi:hypothetical protein
MSKWDFELHVGLPDAGPLGEPLAGITSWPNIDRMREAIYKGQRDSTLICACLQVADIHGLSGEDRYVYLAYQTLVAYERQWKELRRLWDITPMPPIVVPQTAPDRAPKEET